MKPLTALPPGGVGEPLGSAEEGYAGWEATLLDGDAVEAGDTQDRWAQAGQVAGPGAPAPPATKGQSGRGCPSPWPAWKHAPPSASVK